MAWHFPFPSHVDDMLPNMRSRRQTWHMVLSMDANPTTSRQQSRSRPGSRGRPTPCRAEVQSSGVTKSDTSLHLTYELGAEDRGGGVVQVGYIASPHRQFGIHCVHLVGSMPCLRTACRLPPSIVGGNSTKTCFIKALALEAVHDTTWSREVLLGVWVRLGEVRGVLNAKRGPVPREPGQQCPLPPVLKHFTSRLFTLFAHSAPLDISSSRLPVPAFRDPFRHLLHSTMKGEVSSMLL